MRTFARLGAVAAAAALASATALAGAGVAAADEVEPVFNSPSSVSISGMGEDAEVTYTNKSDHDLTCMALVGPGDVIAQLYAMAKSGEFDVTTDDEQDVPEEFDELEEGKLGMLMGIVAKGATADLVSPADFFPEGVDIEFPELTDASFAPAAVAICSAYGDDEGEDMSVPVYTEIEVTPGAGVPGFLGSLDAGLAGIGSSGSVANVTGSLGS